MHHKDGLFDIGDLLFLFNIENSLNRKSLLSFSDNKWKAKNR